MKFEQKNICIVLNDSSCHCEARSAEAISITEIAALPAVARNDGKILISAMYKNIIIMVLSFALVNIGLTGSVLALEKQKIDNILTSNDFVVGPTKIEVILEPGATTTQNIYVTNRLGAAANFKIEVEDLAGSSDASKPVVLLGQTKGPYSLKDYLRPAVDDFTLENGERATVPVSISLPPGLGAGGLYGSVLISTVPTAVATTNNNQEVAGQIQTVGRIGVLFFVRVQGQAQETGRLEKFTTADSRSFYQQGPINFSFSYRNEGNVHLNPYGLLTIKNILGGEVEKINIEPFFVLPQSVRQLEKQWSGRLSVGFYTATVALNRGYNNIIDTKTINFYILPWKIVILSALAILLLIFIIWWLMTHLEFKKKT